MTTWSLEGFILVYNIIAKHPPLLPLQNKMHNSSISQQTSPSHSDPCTVYLPTHLLDFYGKCSYRYTIRIQSYPYINPMGMRFSHFNLNIRQTLRAHVFWSVAFSCLARCSSGSGRHFFRGGGRFFLTSEFAGGVRLFRRFGDLARDLGIWRVRKTRDLQNVQNFPTPTIKATTFTHHHLRIEPGKSRFKVGEKIHDHLGCECDLVGGWTNPVEKYARQNGNLPQVGVKIKGIPYQQMLYPF